MKQANPDAIRDRFFEQLGNEQVFVRLYDHLPAVYFFVKDADGRFIYVNAALRKVLGVSEREIIGKTDDDFFAPELCDAYRAEDREVMNAGRTIADRVWLVPDRRGALRWFVSTKTPLVDRRGGVIGIAGAMQDVENTGAVLGPYQRMSDVVRFIGEHYDRKISVAQLADLAHLSPSQFNRQFTKLFSMTPARYIMRVRINASCSLLTRTDQDLTSIALRCGFHDASHFVKQFKSLIGMTPGEYRTDTV
jgi:PAS domain S-box-containing protein